MHSSAMRATDGTISTSRASDELVAPRHVVGEEAAECFGGEFRYGNHGIPLA